MAEDGRWHGGQGSGKSEGSDVSHGEEGTVHETSVATW